MENKSSYVSVDLLDLPYGFEVEYGLSGIPEWIILPKKGQSLKFEIRW